MGLVIMGERAAGDGGTRRRPQGMTTARADGAGVEHGGGWEKLRAAASVEVRRRVVVPVYV